jgi:hypothetical protein
MDHPGGHNSAARRERAGRITADFAAFARRKSITQNASKAQADAPSDE